MKHLNKKFCDDKECECFVQSFASCEKSEFWDYDKNENMNPRYIYKYGNKLKYWFLCPKCDHSFDSTLGNITRGQWCSFCSGHRMCQNEKCEMCFNRSFASSNHATNWHFTKNGQLKPRNVRRSTSKSYWFFCNECLHSFLKPLNRSHQSWCPFCGNKSLCDLPLKECRTCFDKSFASSEKSKYWDKEKNCETPREVFKNSNKKYWFICNDCNHSYDTTLANVAGGHGCRFCASALCSDKSCQHCYKRSFAASPRAAFWNQEKNNGVCPRDVTIAQ